MFGCIGIAAYVSVEMALKIMEQESEKMKVDEMPMPWSVRELRQIITEVVSEFYNSRASDRASFIREVTRAEIDKCPGLLSLDTIRKLIREGIAQENADRAARGEEILYRFDVRYDPVTAAKKKADLAAALSGKTYAQRLREQLQADANADYRSWLEWSAAVTDKKREAAKDARKAENAKDMFRLMKELARRARGNLLIPAVDEAEALIAMIEDEG